VGNYLLVQKIGQGQFGVVYKGVSIEDQKKVFAIKCIQKKKLESNSMLSKLFQTEMSVMSKLHHPNIMHLFEFMETANNYYLVIQYCNNGDLETYLKKMGRLAEDEAVYFLMQIMNAFQTLHKNKIMHRDVKLANIFLQDDKIVIGDFGFAKQGVDVTRTKLGTPITMAPELLSSNGNSYTSKADLWSIGVCFYQILYGKTPFEAKSYEDLKEKVKSMSGSNLKFPKDIVVSNECKDLLIRLLQYDANNRIEWKEFFNHALFELHSKAKKGKIQDITQSMFERQNEENVKKEFANNMHQAVENTLFEDPEKAKEAAIAVKTAEEQDLKGDQEKRIEEEFTIETNFKLIRSRYVHEKKTVIFVMYTVRKLRNLAKMKSVFNEMADALMYAACVLLRKGLLFNQNAITSLRAGDNVFKLRDFPRFVKTEENGKILRNFEEDEKIYQTFFQQMNVKLWDEIETKDYKQNIQSVNAMTVAEMPQINQIMMKLFRYFKDKLNFLKMDPALEAEYCLALVHFYYSVNSDDTFGFLKNNEIFEWKTFESETTLENAKETLIKKTA
jgi:serine/threonine-protein kinase ULK/ATG1